MATEYYKFIKVSKQGQEYYYNCPNFFSPSSDCFNYFRADLNRVLLNTLPSQYTVIDCNSVTTSTSTTSTSTTIPVTTSTSTTTTSTTSTTTLKPCDIGFESASFVNNSTFPYDYNLQQGYIQVKLKDSSYSRNYQFRVTSGFNIIKDWTSPVQQLTVAFKLNCANYRILVRDYNDINCEAEILNINIPCLTTTTVPVTTTTSTTSTTIPITTTSTTTQFQYAPCAFYYNLNTDVYYKDITLNTDRLLISNCEYSTDISLFNGNLYLKYGENLIQKINLTTLNKSVINLSIPPNLSNKISTTNSATHDSLGNYYVGDGNIYKFTPLLNNYVYDSTIVNLNESYPSQGDMVYIPNIDAFAMTSINRLTNKSVMIIVKADGSNLILNEINLGNVVSSYAIFIHNNVIYCTQYGQEKNYLLKVDIENGTVTQDTTKKLLNFAFGGTQNANCLAITYNNQFKFGTMTYTCVNTGVFNLKFDILNGGGQYEYSTNNIGFSPISGTEFDFDFPISVDMIYINDITSGKSYKFRRDPSIVCNI